MSALRAFFILCITLLFAPGAKAQNELSPGMEIPFRQYSNEDGFFSKTILHLFQDKLVKAKNSLPGKATLNR